jgi:multidrug efflux pump subunit AcrA (membrane-fusion protein)
MSMENRQHPGFKSLAAVLAAVIIIVAAVCLQPASAQNPGLNSAKKTTTLPDSSAKQTPGKPSAYTVTNSQIIKELVLTGELKAARSVMINAPNIRSSFSNTISFLAPEGAIVARGERIVEFDDSSLLSNKSEAERTLDEAKLNIEKKKADLEAERCDLLNSLAQAESTLKQDELYGKIDKGLLAANTFQKYQLNIT